VRDVDALDTCRLKLTRAQEHYDRFERELADYGAYGGPVELEADNSTPGEVMLRVRLTKGPHSPTTRRTARHLLPTLHRSAGSSSALYCSIRAGLSAYGVYRVYF
jgi:hypothetical protein